MTTNLAAGNYEIDCSIEYGSKCAGLNADAYAQSVQRLMRSLGPSTVLVPSLPLNPAADIWQANAVFAILVHGDWFLQAKMVFATRGTTVEAMAHIIAQAFRDGGAGSDVDVDALARKLITGDALPPMLIGSPIGRVSLRVTRLTSLPTSIQAPPLMDSTGFSMVQRASVHQGDQVVVPSAIAPNSGTPIPLDTSRPYGGTAENPVLPDNPSPGPKTASSVVGYVAGTAVVLAALAWGIMTLSERRSQPPAPQRQR